MDCRAQAGTEQLNRKRTEGSGKPRGKPLLSYEGRNGAMTGFALLVNKKDSPSFRKAQRATQSLGDDAGEQTPKAEESDRLKPDRECFRWY